MNYSLKIDIDAFNDIQNTSEWYEMQSKGLGSRFKNQTKKQINSLKKNPYLFSKKYHEIRCWKIEKFPFLIHYSINEDLKTVNVLAVFHTSRNPEIWKK
ncbi:type II toxin-antitoxin system RelE/ParE family toxin [Flavobacterium sp. UGB4466]|uniref:type II toxin-antitoxin system RelE/ParE family toxin n=1 Tax=Flavobacterium sp. UGB4466 TaxID=2730889 RepID=UPI00192AE446|nr:type II toxin-antitoxin system RelE/ParE family toxin [Flavobacterium sp. UGB4466]